MKKYLSGTAAKFSALILSLALLSACTNHHDGQLTIDHDARRSKTYTFHETLEKGYESVFGIDMPAVTQNLIGFGYINRKITALERNKLVMPEMVENYNVAYKDINKLQKARLRLLSAFDMGARQKAPVAAAMAQVHFDCWLEQQSHPYFQNAHNLDIAEPECKRKFMQFMHVTEKRIGKGEMPRMLAQSKIVLPKRKMSKEPMACDKEYMIFFDFDKFTLNKDARAMVAKIAKDAAHYDESIAIRLVGHADRVGSEEYNQWLSQKRAEEVKKALAQDGVEEDRMSTFAKGESDPLVPTEDGVKKPENRRVEATLTIRTQMVKNHK